MCWYGLFHMHGIAGEPIVQEHRRLAWHRGQVISQQLGYNRVLCHCLLPFSAASLEKDRRLTRLGNAIATERHPHVIALRCRPAKPYPTDHPYGMPRCAGDTVAHYRAIEHIVFGWPKTAKQHNALTVVLTVVVSNVQTHIAITNELHHERARGLGPNGLSTVVANDV